MGRAWDARARSRTTKGSDVPAPTIGSRLAGRTMRSQNTAFELSHNLPDTFDVGAPAIDPMKLSRLVNPDGMDKTRSGAPE